MIILLESNSVTWTTLCFLHLYQWSYNYLIKLFTYVIAFVLFFKVKIKNDSANITEPKYHKQSKLETKDVDDYQADQKQ